MKKLEKMSLEDIKGKITDLTTQLNKLETQLYGPSSEQPATAPVKPALSDEEKSKIRAQMNAINSELQGYHQALTDAAHSAATEKALKAKFCPACGGKLDDSECVNKECELFGKKIGLAGDDGSSGDGDEKKHEAHVTAKTPCEQARESLLKKVGAMEKAIAAVAKLASKQEMTQAEIDLIKNLIALIQKDAAPGDQGDLPQNNQPGGPRSWPSVEDPAKTNLPAVPSAEIPTVTPVESKQPQDNIPAVTVPKVEDPDGFCLLSLVSRFLRSRLPLQARVLLRLFRLKKRSLRLWICQALRL